MKCPYCGNELLAGATSCKKCGEHVGEKRTKKMADQGEMMAKMQKKVRGAAIWIFLIVCLGIGILVYLGAR